MLTLLLLLFFYGRPLLLLLLLLLLYHLEVGIVVECTRPTLPHIATCYIPRVLINTGRPICCAPSAAAAAAATLEQLYCSPEIINSFVTSTTNGRRRPNMQPNRHLHLQYSACIRPTPTLNVGNKSILSYTRETFESCH